MDISPYSSNPSIVTQNGHFYDAQGRQVILHGANLANKNPAAGYLGFTSNDFGLMRRWGFNCVRLGIFWDGLEPEPGKINETYLQGIDQQIAWAKENGLLVFLDMHQDLFSVLFADGAPAWATLTDGQPHVTEGGVWSDAYFTSPAVQAALDHFWANSPAPDGKGLQDHYAQTWRMVAQRYANEPAVIGYDLMNEPFPGSSAAASQFLLFRKGAEILASLEGPAAPTAEELAMQWLDPESRFQILQRLGDINLYAQVIDTTYPLYSSFEKGTLMALYRRAAQAIREVDARHILFLETSIGSNMGVYSGITPLLDAEGKRDDQQAYAAHGYDLVVDTANIANSSAERVSLIFSRHAETASRHHLPMLVGEWGAFGREVENALPAAWMVSHQFEKQLCGDTYWLYAKDLDKHSAFQAISRPYPERAAGIVESYCYDPRARVFECIWKEDPAVGAPTRIYLPEWFGKSVKDLVLDPEEQGYQVELLDNGSTWLNIPPTGKAVSRKVILRH